MKKLARAAVSKRLSVRDLEKLARAAATGPARGASGAWHATPRIATR